MSSQDLCHGEIRILIDAGEVLLKLRWVQNTSDCEAVGLAFKHTFGKEREAEGARCAITILAGNTFADPYILVEVEIDAVVG